MLVESEFCVEFKFHPAKSGFSTPQNLAWSWMTVPLHVAHQAMQLLGRHTWKHRTRQWCNWAPERKGKRLKEWCSAEWRNLSPNSQRRMLNWNDLLILTLHRLPWSSGVQRTIDIRDRWYSDGLQVAHTQQSSKKRLTFGSGISALVWLKES